MHVTRSNILVWTLNLCGLKVIARGVPVVPHVPGDTVMASANNAKATLRRVAEQLLRVANGGGLYCCWFLAGACF